MYHNLKQLVLKIWDGDVTFYEATKTFKPKELRLIEEHLSVHGKLLYKEGLPAPEDLPTWAKKDPAAKLLQKMYNKVDD